MIFILVGVLVLIISSYIILSTQKPKGFPPGPRWLPFVGSLPELKRVSQEAGGQHLGFLKLAAQYNTNVLGLRLGGGGNVIVALSYPVVKAALSMDEFVCRPDNFFMRLRCMGQRRGITAVDGPLWNTQRSFLLQHLRSLGFGRKPMENMIKDELSDLVQSIAEKTDKDSKAIISLSAVLSASVLNILWALMSGARIPKTDPKLYQFLDLMETRNKHFDLTGGLLGTFPWIRYVAPEYSGYNLLLRINNQLRDFVMEPIREHLHTWCPGREDDFIYRFITRMKEEKENETFTIDQLIMVCIDIFIGGSKSTTNSLDFAFLMMILYPDIQNKVQSQLDHVVNKNRQLDYSDRLQVPYVAAVLLEVERYCTVAPIIGPRRVSQDTVLDGYTIPKNTTVLMNIYSVHRDKELWQDPDQFIPERFLDRNGQLVYNDKLLIFGLGKRRCIAEPLARNYIFMLFAGILREYTISADPNSPSPTGRQLPGILLSPEKYNACFIKRTVVT